MPISASTDVNFDILADYKPLLTEEKKTDEKKANKLDKSDKPAETRKAESTKKALKNQPASDQTQKLNPQQKAGAR
jgi:hypothetical protein